MRPRWRSVWVAGLLASTLTCGPRQDHRSAPSTASHAGFFRPRTVAAANYNEATEAAAPDGSLESLLLDLVTQLAVSNGRASPTPDPRLAAAAKDLAAEVQGDRPPSYDVIEFALQHHGIVEPSPHLMVVEMSRGGEDALIQELKARLPRVLATGRYRRFGAGSFDDGDARVVRVVIALQESFLETDPIPRGLPHLGSAELRGRLLYPYRGPHVFVTPARGNVESVAMVTDPDGGFRAWIRCGDTDGRYQVEVGGEDKLGSEVLANFPVYCGDPPPAELAVRPDDGPVIHDPAEAEEVALKLLNADRVAAGVPALQLDERVAKVARGHSQDMMDHDFVGHVSPTTGTASDRLRRVGIGSPTVLENVARAYSPDEAEAGLMGSPGHRANIMNPDVTHVGIGITLGREVSGRPELFETQVFIRIPPRLDPARAVNEVRAVIAERRAAVQAGALDDDPELGKLAGAYARALASGEARQAANARLDAGLDRLGGRFSVVKTNVMVVGAVSQIAGAKNAEDREVTHLGVGIAQGKDRELGDQALFVVLLLGRER